MEVYIGEVILAIVLIIVSILLRSAITGKVDEVNNKLDTVINNQTDHKIELEQLKKDVESNTGYGKESKDKIEQATRELNILNMFMSSSIEKFKNLEKDEK